MDKKYPALFKHHTSTTVDKLIKKRSIPQKLSPHSKRYEQTSAQSHELSFINNYLDSLRLYPQQN